MGMSRSAPFTTAQEALWERLQPCSLATPAATQRFHKKLARDNGWSARFAARVEAGHGVCPSPAFDQAWHPHLLDPRWIWEQFCPEVLGPCPC
jgi:hypothetical protein